MPRRQRAGWARGSAANKLVAVCDDNEWIRHCICWLALE